MESTMRELSLLEEKSKLWRKHHEEQSEMWRKYYEEEQRRIEEEYQQELVKMEEEFEKAAQKMRADFSAKRKAVLRQYYGSKVSEGTVEEPIPIRDKTQPQNDCTKTSCPKKAVSSSSVQQSVISGDRVCTSHTKREELTKTAPADFPTAVSFVRAQSPTSPSHRSDVAENESEVKTNPAKTMAFAACDVYGCCAKQNCSDVCARRRRDRKRGDRHRLKTLLFDPGGYCVLSSGTSWLDLRVPTAIYIYCSTVPPSRSRLLCSKAFRQSGRASIKNGPVQECEYLVRHQFHGGECCVQFQYACC
ncbi:uncharacterized protein LOC134285839 [Aedes albopictus]|uniref:Uncharacterized protein n=1 Tax=Aedes albopictus TaxID=7160 RepID=A0ABM1YVA0_AEDAL